jgi:hypothetical protein
MASIPTREDFLAATHKSQEAMIAAIKTWFETVRTATPRLTSVYAPLTERLSKLPPVVVPFADKLPTPEEAVDSAYHMAEQLLANQRKFAEDLLKAMTPLMPGRSETAPEDNGPSAPKVPGHRVWQEAVAATEPKPVAVSEPKPVAVSEPKPVAVTEEKAEAPARPADKSTPARPTPRSTAARSTASGSTASKGSAAKSGAAKSAAGASAPNRTSARRAPKGTDAS